MGHYNQCDHFCLTALKGFQSERVLGQVGCKRGTEYVSGRLGKVKFRKTNLKFH